MNENYKTIKELADELGVSKSYVDKIIRILKLHTKLDKVGNKYVISKKQEKAIITRIEKPKTTTESTTKLHTKVNSEVDFLKEEIAYLKSNHDMIMRKIILFMKIRSQIIFMSMSFIIVK